MVVEKERLSSQKQREGSSASGLRSSLKRNVFSPAFIGRPLQVLDIEKQRISTSNFNLFSTKVWPLLAFVHSRNFSLEDSTLLSNFDV